MNSKVSSDWLPSYIKAMRRVLEILEMSGYFPDSHRKSVRYLERDGKHEAHFILYCSLPLLCDLADIKQVECACVFKFLSACVTTARSETFILICVLVQ